jgi:hypothetical protein
MQPIFFQKAGKIRLNKYVDGKPVTSPETTFTRAGVVQSIQPNITINGTPIPDGNSLWNAINPDTSIEGDVVVTLGTMPPDLYAFIMGDKVTELTNVSFPINDEEILIPDTSPYTVTLENTPDTDKPIILVGADASAWAKVSATPAKGQYSVSASAVEFSSADKGKTVFATYNYTADKGKSFGLPKNPRRTSMELIISGEATGDDESTMYNVATIVDRCKVQGTISPPQQGREPQPVSITFNVQKPRGNKRAVDFVAVPITE